MSSNYRSILNAQGSSFSNTNSFSFDGIDEYFLGGSTYTELDGQSKATISAWIKVEANTDSLSYLCSIKGGSFVTIAIRLQTTTNTQCWVYVNGAGNNSRAFANIGTIKNDGLWHHLVVCLDLSLANYQECQIYLDNVPQSMGGYFAGATLPNANSGLFIGNRDSAYSGHFGGKVDELAIWSGTDLRNDVATIYNNGVPNDLNNNGLTAPTTWQRMGDNATWNGATWTMLDVNARYMNRSINMVEANRTTDVPTTPSFSNTKSIALDGVDDYVDCGNDSSLQMSGNFSISIWIKYSAAFTGYAFSGCGNKYGIYIQSNLIILQHRNLSNAFRSVSSTSAFNDGNWHHVLGVNDGTNLLLYIDGVLNNSNALGGASITSTLSARIGSISTTSGWEFSGNIDEVAVWNSDQSANASTIYNSGVPNDISSLSPLSWWRCGDEDTSPTLTDNGSASNDGTMTNFTTFSTDVPT